MEDMRFVEDQDKFLDYAWSVYQPYFKNRDNFNIQYNKIHADKEKNCFLKAISYYYFFVIIGDYTSPIYGKDELSFVDHTNKYLAITSIIESLYQENYLDFYEWIMRNKEQVLPINDKDNLSYKYSLYKNDNGCTVNFVKFFQSLDPRIIIYIQRSIIFLEDTKGTNELDEKEETIEVISKLLYQIRSDFVHRARLVLEFHPRESISLRSKRIITCSIEMEHLCRIFEAGLLKHFNITPDTQPI